MTAKNLVTESEALAAIRQWRDDVDGGEPVFLDRLDAILALVQPAEGVVLSREDAALAARALRSIRGDRSLIGRPWNPGDPGALYDRMRVLAERLEQEP